MVNQHARFWRPKMIKGSLLSLNLSHLSRLLYRLIQIGLQNMLDRFAIVVHFVTTIFVVRCMCMVYDINNGIVMDQVSRMLLGGMKVVGIYVWASDIAFKNSTMILCQVTLLEICFLAVNFSWDHSGRCPYDCLGNRRFLMIVSLRW